MTYADNNLTILVVGNIEQLLASKPELPLDSDTIYCVIGDLSAAFLEHHQPHIILSPLVTSQYDVIDLAIVLDQLNFAGRFRALTAPLPDPDIILREVRFECPALDFDLIVVNTDQKLRSV